MQERGESFRRWQNLCHFLAGGYYYPASVHPPQPTRESEWLMLPGCLSLQANVIMRSLASGRPLRCTSYLHGSCYVTWDSLWSVIRLHGSNPFFAMVIKMYSFIYPSTCGLCQCRCDRHSPLLTSVTRTERMLMHRCSSKRSNYGVLDDVHHKNEVMKF